MPLRRPGGRREKMCQRPVRTPGICTKRVDNCWLESGCAFTSMLMRISLFNNVLELAPQNSAARMSASEESYRHRRSATRPKPRLFSAACDRSDR